MGTNFYLKLKDFDEIELNLKKDMEKLYKKYNLSFYDFDLLTYVENFEIHIGKTSAGWKPLFQKQDCFDSISKLENFYKESKRYDIYDEYEVKYTWKEFTERVLNFNPNGKTHKNVGFSDFYIDDDGFEFVNSEFC